MPRFGPAALVLLTQAAAPAWGFVAPPPRWPGEDRSGTPAARPVQALLASSAGTTPSSAPGLSGGAIFAGAALAGVVVAFLSASKKAERADEVGMRGWQREPAPPGMLKDGDWTRGPRYRTWVNLNRRAVKIIGRQRFFRQKQLLAEAGITAAKGGYQKWYPTRNEHNLYKGPESHPDNPDFPAASGGYRALRGWAPAQLSVSAPRSGSAGGAFAGGSLRLSGGIPAIGSAKRALPGASRAQRAGLVLKAHKKAASSSKNQGHSLNAHFWGITKRGHQGSAVKAGQLLLKQKGNNWYPGSNVVRAKDFSLHSLKDGIVQWRGEYKHREVFVVPWEYVREKCKWINPNTLAPKEYQPWMGNHNWGKRHYILRLRRLWLQGEVGTAWLNKKTEKKQKQKAIQAKIREYCKLRREGKLPAKGEPGAPAPVGAGTESESEGEA